jgi:hypothetical protein
MNTVSPRLVALSTTLAWLLAACATAAPGAAAPAATPAPRQTTGAPPAGAAAARDNSGQGYQAEGLMEPGPRVRVPPPSEVALEDRVWYWTCAQGSPHQQYMEFLADGTVRYDYHQGHDPKTFTYHNAVWAIEDGRLLIDYNQGYAIDAFPLAARDGGRWVGVPAKTRNCPEVVLEVYR